MMTDKPTNDPIRQLLLVEDDGGLVRLFEEELVNLGLEVHSAATGKQALSWVVAHPDCLMVLDYSLPDMTAQELIEAMRMAGGVPPFIVITGRGDERVAVAMMKLGARDYLVKDVAVLERLPLTVERVRREVMGERERQRMSEALVESEHRYRDLFNLIPDAIFLLNENGRIMEVSAVAIERYGYTREEFKVMTPIHLAPEGLAPGAMAKVRQAVKEPSRFEWRHRRKDGSEFPVEITTQPTIINGAPFTFAVARDISERTEAEANQHLTVDVLQVLNRAGNLSDMTRELLTLIKRRTECDAVGLRLRQGDDFPYYVQEGFSEEFVRKESHLCARNKEGGIQWDAEGRPILECTCGLVLSGRKDPVNPLFTVAGSIWTNHLPDLLSLPVERELRTHPRNECVFAGYESVALIALRFKDEILGLLQLNSKKADWFSLTKVHFFEGLASAIAIGIKRMQAEIELEHSREDWKNIFKAIGHPAAVLAPDYSILAANPAFLKSSSLNADALRGMPCWKTCCGPELSHPVSGCPMEVALLSGHQETREIETDTGSYLIACTPVKNAEGRVEKVIHIATDITEIKRLQRDLLQSQKMETVGRLAGGVAHDFNNILQAIEGYSTLLLDSTPESDGRRHDIEEILRSGRRASDLTKQLLAFSRRQMLMPRIVNLNDIINNLNKMIARLIGENVKCKLELEPALHRVKVDPGQMDQVIMNLVVNARDAMPNGGNLVIRTDNIVLSEKDMALHPDGRPGRFIRLAVGDNGIGISQEDQARIYDPFFTTKARGKGTGLGLAMVYGIVKQHEGWISVYSEIGMGSTFSIYLAAAPDDIEEEVVSPPSERPIQKGKGESILVVEDDEAVRELAIGVLTRSGYKVTGVGTCAEAIKAFDEQVDLIFTDVGLPDGNGFDMAWELKKRKPGVKCVLASGYTDIQERWPRITSSGWAFLIKPFSQEAMRRTVAAALQKG